MSWGEWGKLPRKEYLLKRGDYIALKGNQPNY